MFPTQGQREELLTQDEQFIRPDGTFTNAAVDALLDKLDANQTAAPAASQAFVDRDDQRAIDLAAIDVSGYFARGGSITIPGSGGWTSAAGVLAYLRTSPQPAEVAAIDSKIRTAKEDVARWARIERAWQADDERRAQAREPIPDDDPMLESMRASARAIDEKIAYRNSTEGRLEVIESILGEIRDALVKR
jgi:hypothetical protein